ncbi:hypothetical protein [Cohaesibacter haloalkalitolerans]|uniref:hypothetical protein n=1 Tax=Cohaesibacter haloalkalitolerans TaxID=1162980 RepID=UPI0013C5331D|nr:hypothetical protein [Cohaesibacter haloalkalitolerans]
MSRLSLIAVLLATGAGLCLPIEATKASAPVKRVIEGCVLQGKFISQRGYHIKVRAHGRTVDLSPYEGMEIRYTGNLLPGDRYTVQTAPLILGPCRKPPKPLF